MKTKIDQQTLRVQTCLSKQEKGILGQSPKNILEKQNKIGKQKHADKIYSTSRNKQIMSKSVSRHNCEDV